MSPLYLYAVLAEAPAGALPSGGMKASLLAAGVRGWICVPLVRQGQVQGIMGFESSRPLRDGLFPPPVLRLGGDAWRAASRTTSTTSSAPSWAIRR